MKNIRIGVTASRKSVQLTAALRQRGADVVLGPMLSGDRPAADETIVTDTRIILDQQPTWVVATSAIGMRLWLEAADRAELGDQLRALLQSAQGVARGAKPVAGFATIGVKPAWVSAQETDADVASWLTAHVKPGELVALQLHGGRSHAYRHLSQAGIDVLTVMPYTSAMPLDDDAAKQLIAELCAGRLDLVTFTSPNAARNLFTIAESMGDGVVSECRRQLSGPTAVASIGPVTSEALEELGAVVQVTPRRYRTGDLIRSIDRWAETSSSRSDIAAPAGSTVEVRMHPESREVSIGQKRIALGPREYQILATMARDREAVFRPAEFAVRVWGHDAPTDPAMVRHQVARLRRKLADTPLQITTVRGVGYRLCETPDTAAS